MKISQDWAEKEYKRGLSEMAQDKTYGMRPELYNFLHKKNGS